MIPSAAIKAFLKALRDDHRWMKKLTAKQVDRALAELHPRPKLYKKLRTHQKICFLLGVAYPQFSFWVDMGGGKTLISYELLRYWFQAKKVRRALVFIKTDKAFPTWEKQWQIYNIGVPLLCLDADSSAGKWEQLSQFDRGIIIVPYASAVAMVHATKGGRGKDKNRWQLDDKLVRKLGKEVDAVILDESTQASGDSLTGTLCRRLSADAFARYALAGRPFGREPQILWRQQFIIDRGESLGATLGLFRSAFYSESDNPWDPRGYLKDYTFIKTKMKLLSRLAQHRSITYEEHELTELPPIVPIEEEIRLPQEAGAYYKRLVEQAVLAKGNWRELKNVFLRMRQLSSGYIGFINDDTGAKAEITFDVNPKLERLLDLVEDLPSGHKMVVFYEFTFSGRLIVKRLEEMKLKCNWIWSGTKDYRKQLSLFQEDPDHNVMVINNNIGAYSLDGLQVANYVCFYESPVSSLAREQAERRVKREGQTRKVFQYDLIVKGTQDARIRQFHKEGSDLFTAFKRDPAILTK